MIRHNDGLLPLRGAQALAAEPQAHVWLSASAGTGKTHVLTARVFRLLLGGVPPENILCLTFTKAGASEMAERIHARLAAWVQMSDAELAADLKALGEDLGPEGRGAARRLFARVLEATGGGLRIQTIHSFCQQLLSSFPLEAGLVPGFRALEDREQRELARQSLEELVIDAEARGDETLFSALHALSLRMGEKEATAYLEQCGRAHAALVLLPDDLEAWLLAALDLPEGDIEAAIATACSDTAFPIDSLTRIARANRDWATKTGLGNADIIAAWLAAAPADRAKMLANLGGVFLRKTDGLPKKIEKGQEKADPDYPSLAESLCKTLSNLIDLRLRAAYARLAAQGLHAGRAFALAYQSAKRRAGAVDYDDLIEHAATLLKSEGIADWIRYKLDQRIDHILVDEAQDTNSDQWAIIGALVDEFFAGEGARGGTLRTLFTVGDFKQAIFGFQGTSPHAFAEAKGYFQQRAWEAEQTFQDLSLDESFRSTPAVLEAVDATVATLGVEALGLPPGGVGHASARPYPGTVALMKPVSIAASTGEEDDPDPQGEEDWLADQDRLLAERIAGQIKAWLDRGLMLESKGRPLRPGDIMILLRKRGALARLIVARLYEARVPVAGIDRLRLQAPLGVQDLMAALRFASQPEDDLNLACLLVSPFIGWSQKQLLERAVPRTGSLWRHLRESEPVPADDLAALYDILGRADLVTPYRLLEHILSGPMLGRRKLIERLGEQANDSIDELLNAALTHEQREQPSLQAFIDWFDREEGDIKREDDGRTDAVRLLTVHGAKGLQAPLVILADACADPDTRRGGTSLDIPLGDDLKLPFVPPRKAERWGVIEAAATAAAIVEMQEHWRLLYVAMTRAEEQLYLTGALGPRARGQIPQQSWFAAVERAMTALGADWREDSHWGATMPWAGSARLKPRAAAKAERQQESQSLPLPIWTVSEAPKEARPPRPLAPTARAEDEQPFPPPSLKMLAGAERGRLLHSLFERLPDVPAEKRREAADIWLARQGGVADPHARSALIEEALGIIDDPAHGPLFAPDALAEAPIAAVVGSDVVNGVIDRLAVGERIVRLVDFKTGRVPAHRSAIPVAHLRQMGAYAAALEVIFPGRAIEPVLLYTAGPAVFALSADQLSEHKPGLIAE